MNRVVVHDRRQTGGGHISAVVALLLVVGAVVGWRILPPDMLGGGEEPGSRALAVTVLVMAPLALLAAAAGGWLAGRRGWLAAGTRGPLNRSAVTAGIFAVLALVTAPVQRAAFAWLSPPPLRPNLAAVGYHSEAVKQAHQEMLHHDGVSPLEKAAINAGFYPQTRGGFRVDYALQDALFLFVIAAPLILLALVLAARFASRVTLRLPGSLVGVRSRWAAAGVAVVLAAVGTVVVASAARAQVTPFTQQLRIPPVLAGANVTLQMRQADVQIMPSGPPTRMWTYNGIFPGPTIRRPSGTTTRVTSATTCRQRSARPPSTTTAATPPPAKTGSRTAS